MELQRHTLFGLGVICVAYVPAGGGGLRCDDDRGPDNPVVALLPFAVAKLRGEIEDSVERLAHEVQLWRRSLFL